MRTPVAMLLVILLAGCASNPKRPGGKSYTLEDLRKLETKFRYDEAMEDSTYGFSEKNPINSAYRKDTTEIGGPFTERFYLDHLTTADGRPIKYHRLGSCCMLESKNSPFGPVVPLDKYEIKFEGQDREVTLYINMYDEGDVHAPVGFRLNRLKGIDPAP